MLGMHLLSFADIFAVGLCSGFSEKQLLGSLFTDYNKDARPVFHPSENVTVKFDLVIHKLLDMVSNKIIIQIL